MPEATAVIEIRDIAFGGKGVGQLPDGKACFVPEVIVGERVEVRIRRETTRFAEGEVVRLVEISPQRVKAPCPYFGVCGGCSYQHMPYPMQLEVKRRQVREVLRRLGGFDAIEVAETVAAPLPYGYRNRITVHCARGKIGFHRRDGRGLVDIEQCIISSDAVNRRLEEFRRGATYDGIRTLREHDDRRGFHQTNDSVAELLSTHVTKAAGRGPALVDAYCGTGFFARRLRDAFDKVIGIEWNPAAVKIAREHATANEEHLEGDVKSLLPAVLDRVDSAGTTAILDPPAQGVDGEVIEALSRAGIARIIYVSCNPATLARDLKRLAGRHELATVTPFDMFPQTAEIEVVAELRLRADTLPGTE
jgi:23S rRNA (uracil1939-C5)-methyltransferase